MVKNTSRRAPERQPVGEGLEMVLALLEERLAADDGAPLGHIDIEGVPAEDDGEAARLTRCHEVVDHPQVRILCELVRVLLAVVRLAGVGLLSVVHVGEAVDVWLF